MKDHTEDLINFAAEIEAMIRGIRDRGYQHCALDQISRSSTSIFANFSECMLSQTVPDCRNKLAIASKEAQETLAWIKFLDKINLIDRDSYDVLSDWCITIIVHLDDCVFETYENDTPTDWLKELKKHQNKPKKTSWGKKVN